MKSRVEKSSQKKEDPHASRVRATRKKIHTREMLGKPTRSFCQWFVLPDVRTLGLVKRRVQRQLFSRDKKDSTPLWREAIFESKLAKHLMHGPLFEVPMYKNRTPLWCEAHLQVKMHKSPHVRTAFWSSDVEKSHATVARSTCVSQNVQATSCSDTFWIQRSKNGTPLWREAHFQVKMYKTPPRFAALLDLPMWKRCPTEEIDRLILDQSINQSVR